MGERGVKGWTLGSRHSCSEHDQGGKTSLLRPAPQSSLYPSPALKDINTRTLTHGRTPAPRPAGGTLAVKGDGRRGGQCAESGAQVAPATAQVVPAAPQANLRGASDQAAPRTSPRSPGPPRPLVLTQMMRLSHSGSSDCGSGCVSSMAGTAVNYTADTKTSSSPRSARRRCRGPARPSGKLGSQAQRPRRSRAKPRAADVAGVTPSSPLPLPRPAVRPLPRLARAARLGT